MNANEISTAKQVLQNAINSLQELSDLWYRDDIEVFTPEYREILKLTDWKKIDDQKEHLKEVMIIMYNNILTLRINAKLKQLRKYLREDGHILSKQETDGFYLSGDETDEELKNIAIEYDKEKKEFEKKLELLK